MCILDLSLFFTILSCNGESISNNIYIVSVMIFFLLLRRLDLKIKIPPPLIFGPTMFDVAPSSSSLCTIVTAIIGTHDLQSPGSAACPRPNCQTNMFRLCV